MSVHFILYLHLKCILFCLHVAMGIMNSKLRWKPFFAACAHMVNSEVFYCWFMIRIEAQFLQKNVDTYGVTWANRQMIFISEELNMSAFQQLISKDLHQKKNRQTSQRSWRELHPSLKDKNNRKTPSNQCYQNSNSQIILIIVLNHLFWGWLFLRGAQLGMMMMYYTIKGKNNNTFKKYLKGSEKK